MAVRKPRRHAEKAKNCKRITLARNMRMWRNWQTRRFQVPVGNRVGSNPFIRTKKSRTSKEGSPTFFCTEHMKGFEGGSRFAGAKRFAVEIKIKR